MLIGRHRGGPIWLQSFSPWTPSQLDDVVDWLPLNAGAGATQEELTNYISGAAAVYRGSDGTIEPTDPTWTAEGLSFDGGDYCTMSPLLSGDATASLSVMVCAKIPVGAAYDSLYSEGRTGHNNVYVNLQERNSNGIQLALKDDAGHVKHGIFGAGTDYSDGQWRTYGFTLTLGGWGSVYVDGAQVGGAAQDYSAIGTITLDNAHFGVLERAAFANYFTGSMAYAVRDASELSVTEMANLHNYIRRQVARRGITLPRV